MIEIDITIPEKLYRKDSIDILCHVNFDLDEYIIRAEIFDRFYSALKLSSEVIGEITIDSEDNGTFTISIPKKALELFHLVSYIEIEIEDEDGKSQTIYFAPIKFQDDIFFRAN